VISQEKDLLHSFPVGKSTYKHHPYIARSSGEAEGGKEFVTRNHREGNKRSGRKGKGKIRKKKKNNLLPPRLTQTNPDHENKHKKKNGGSGGKKTWKPLRYLCEEGKKKREKTKNKEGESGSDGKKEFKGERAKTLQTGGIKRKEMSGEARHVEEKTRKVKDS